MSTNTDWTALVEKNNAKVYRIPEGWDARDDVAEQLNCSPERVSEVLRHAIKGGEVEKKVFPVWDGTTKRVTQVTAYRRAPKSGVATTSASSKK
jgi:hypothetical protein